MFTLIKQLKEKIIANKSSLIKIAIFLGIYLLFSDFAFATETGQVKQSNEIESIKSKVVEVGTWITTAASLFLGLMTYLVTMFLSPDWTNGSLFGMTEKFKSLWILVSNFVYLVFAFILIFVAFMNIVGKQGYEFKQSIPKFIVGILIVPFSWFFVNFMVSLSSVLFVGAMNLPHDTFPEFKNALENVEVPKKCSIDFKSLTNNQQNPQKESSKSIYSCGEEKAKLGDVFKTGKASDGVFGIMSMYTYGIVGVENFSDLKFEAIKQGDIKNIGDIIVHIIFNLLFIVIYTLLMVALGLALLIRGIRLWIYMILSPLFGLMYFFGKGKEGFFKNFNFGEFIALALVPVYTMLALSFGLLFIWVTGQGLLTTGDGGDVTLKNESNGNSKLKIGNENGFELELIGGAVGTDEGIAKMFGAAKNVGNSALGIIGTLILKIFGIVVLWGAVMAALKQSEITKEITAPIAGFGENIGKAVTSLPQYVPILPGGQSLKSLENFGSNLEYGIKNAFKVTERSNSLASNLGIGQSNNSEVYNRMKNTQNIKTGSDREANRVFIQGLIDMYRQMGNDAFKDKNFQEVAMLQGLDVKDFRNINDLANALHKHTYSNINYDFIYGRGQNDYIKYLSGEKKISSESDEQTNSSSNQTNNQNVININLANRQITLPTSGNGTSYQVSDAGNISNTIKSSLGVDNNGNKVTITENEIKSALNGKGISDDIINQVIDSLRNDGRIS